MPPGADESAESTFLTVPERKALVRCLMKEYFGGYKEVENEPFKGILATYIAKCPTSEPSTPQPTARPTGSP
jgi:hypothetical protein